MYQRSEDAKNRLLFSSLLRTSKALRHSVASQLKRTGTYPHFHDLEKYSNNVNICRYMLVLASLLFLSHSSFMSSYREATSPMRVYLQPLQ